MCGIAYLPSTDAILRLSLCLPSSSTDRIAIERPKNSWSHFTFSFPNFFRHTVGSNVDLGQFARQEPANSLTRAYSILPHHGLIWRMSAFLKSLPRCRFSECSLGFRSRLVLSMVFQKAVLIQRHCSWTEVGNCYPFLTIHCWMVLAHETTGTSPYSGWSLAKSPLLILRLLEYAFQYLITKLIQIRATVV